MWLLAVDVGLFAALTWYCDKVRGLLGQQHSGSTEAGMEQQARLQAGLVVAKGLDWPCKALVHLTFSPTLPACVC